MKRDGNTFEQNVTRIGKSRSQKKAVAEAPEDEGLQSYEEASQAATLSSGFPPAASHVMLGMRGGGQITRRCMHGTKVLHRCYCAMLFERL